MQLGRLVVSGNDLGLGLELRAKCEGISGWCMERGVGRFGRSKQTFEFDSTRTRVDLWLRTRCNTI